MYKVFINHKTIFLTQEISDLKLEVEDVLAHPHSKSALIDEYHRFINNPFALRLYLHEPDHPNQLYRDFLSMFVKIEAAGGLVLNSSGQFLFIFRYGKWDLPKGKIEPFEKKNEAALREVEEETAIGDLAIIHPLIRTRHLYEEKRKQCMKLTWWYFMKTSTQSLPVPQSEEGITKAQWIDRDNLNEVMKNTYPSIIEVIKSYFQLEEQMLNQKEQ
ncbi:MAG: NUDIX domain-containing protein [Bacillota bacterium]|nr:NUDIX domain-containing protein [Bacillota bacterium]